MTRKELQENPRFNYLLKEFTQGFGEENYEIYGNVIKINAYPQNLYTLLDENFNVIGFYTNELSLDYHTQEEIEQTIAQIYKDYCKGPENSEKKLPKPFDVFSLKQLMDLNERIITSPENHGRILDIKVNGREVTYDYKDIRSEIGFNLLAYISFLGYNLRRYYKQAFQMKLFGFEYPDFYSYLNALVSNVERAVKEVDNAKVGDVLYYIGDASNRNYDSIGTELDYLLRLYDLDPEKVKGQKVDRKVFLKILDIPKETVKERYEERRKGNYPDSIDINEIINQPYDYSTSKQKGK